MRTYNAAVSVWQGGKAGIDAQSEQPVQEFDCRPPAPQHNPGGAALDAKHFFLDLSDGRSGICAH